MARSFIRPQSPRGITLGIAVLLWLVGALEVLAGVEMPGDLARIALLVGGALLILGCLIKGL